MVPIKELDASIKPTVKRLTSEQVDDYRRKKEGTMFKCDEKFLPGHKYSIKKLMMIEIDYPKDVEEEILFEPKEKDRDKDAKITIHVMEGGQ